ncbi:Cleavage stimulation factor subunit 77 [Galdieria sulphuraria]|nr:Cleavage stimulation factor subunit 77 [Galdieria sulphuraria]
MENQNEQKSYRKQTETKKTMTTTSENQLSKPQRLLKQNKRYTQIRQRINCFYPSFQPLDVIGSCTSNTSGNKEMRKWSRKSRTEATEAYEFALKHLGLDIQINHLWNDYIVFIQEWEPRNAQEENTKRDQLRSAYQRALQTPMYNLDNFWKEYENFENSLNRTLAKGLLSEYQPLYSAARAEFRARKNRREGLLLNVLACPPSPKMEEQVRLWRKYIEGEKSNPHKLETEELHKRVVAAYEQAIICLYRYPDLWLEIYFYHVQRRDLDTAKEYLYRGIQACPECAMLYFCLADLEESMKNFSIVESLYEELLKLSPSSLVYIQYMQFLRRVKGIDASRKLFLRARKEISDYHLYIAAAELEYYRNKNLDAALNIFELGLKSFPQVLDFALEFIAFLWMLGDETNLQALFERLLLEYPVEDSPVIWDKYCQFAQSFFGLEKRREIEMRRLEAIGGGEKFLLESTLSYYSFRDVNGWTSSDLLYIGDSLNSRQSIHTVSSLEPKSTKSTTKRNRTSIDSKRTESNFSSHWGGNSGSLLESLQALMNMFPFASDIIPDVNYVLNLVVCTPDNVQGIPNIQNEKSRGEKRKNTSDWSKGMNPNSLSPPHRMNGMSTEEEEVEENAPTYNVPSDNQRLPTRDIFRVRQAQRQAKST